MIIEEGKFYFIKEEFFEIFRDYRLMDNKEMGTKRPCYFCFRDRKQRDIIWFVPLSTKYEKYKRIYEYKKQKQKKVYNFVFGEVVGKQTVFLIQNIFPITEKYILGKYTTESKDVDIPLRVKNKVIAYSRQVIEMAENGINIPFYDIKEMKILLLENN